jgi:hypothetical protein
MTLRVHGDGKQLEAMDGEVFRTVVERAKEYGVISHRFWTNGSEVLVVDEWPDQGSFQKFFDASPEIPEMMQRAGVTETPEVSFWEPLDTGDQVG